MRGFTALLSALLSPDASLLRGRVWLFKESQGLKVISSACSTELSAFFPFSSFFFFFLNRALYSFVLSRCCLEGSL